MRPELLLRYNSESGVSKHTGFGWQLGIGKITRHGYRGAPVPASAPLDFESQTFVMETFGTTRELVLSPRGEQILEPRYRDNWKVETTSVFDGWVAYDTEGNQFHFETQPMGIEGQAAANVQYLSKIVTPHETNLYVRYERGSSLMVSGFDLGDRAFYPVEIIYSCVDPDTDHCLFVDFEWVPRPDVVTSGRTGELVAWTQRLETVSVTAGLRGSSTFVRRYRLGYAQDPVNLRSLLKSVAIESETGATFLQPETFDYRHAELNGAWSEFPTDAPGFIQYDQNRTGVLLADLDHDARVDLAKRQAVKTTVASEPSMEADHINYMNVGGTVAAVGPALGAKGRWFAWTNAGSDHVYSINARPGYYDGDGALDLAVRATSPGGAAYEGVFERGIWSIDGDVIRTSAEVPIYNPPFMDDGCSDTAMNEFVDIDADGSTDILRSGISCGVGSTAWRWNDVAGAFEEAPQWTPPTSDGAGRFADFNGDGLVDYYRAAHTPIESNGVYLNTGDGFLKANELFGVQGQLSPQDKAVFFPDGTLFPGTVNGGGVDTGWRLVDINADGIIDLVRSIGALSCSEPCPNPYVRERTRVRVLLGRADGTFVFAPFGFPLASILYDQRIERLIQSGRASGWVEFKSIADAGVRFADWNADGRPDVLRGHWAKGDGKLTVWINEGAVDVGRLIRRTTDRGASIDYAYRAYAKVGQPTLSPRIVVDSVEQRDPSGALWHKDALDYDLAISILPSHSDYDPRRGNEFLGFRSLDRKRWSFYDPQAWLQEMQGESGVPEYAETPCRQTQIVFPDEVARADQAETTTTWNGCGDDKSLWRRSTMEFYAATDHSSASDVAPFRSLVRKKSTVHYGPTNRATHVYFLDYDEYGLPTDVFETGRMFVTGDELRTTIEYAHDEDAWIIGRVAKHRTSPGGSSYREVRRFYDDNFALGTVSGQGRLTFKLVTASGALPSFVAYEHDPHGNVLEKSRSAASPGLPASTTTFSYDEDFRMFNVSTENALGHVATRTYWGVNEPGNATGRFGLMAREYGPATAETPAAFYERTTYDAFGRAKSILKHGADGALLRYRFYARTFDASTGTEKVRLYQKRNAYQYDVADEYIDGFGRVVRTARRHDDGSFVFVDTSFGPGPKVFRQSRPYRSDEPLHWETTWRDGLGRRILLQAPNRELSYSYGAFEHHIQDENGRTTSYERDARKRVIRVTEPGGRVTQIGHGYGSETIVSPAGVSTFVERDGHGRVTRRIDPDRGEMRWELDTNGEPIRIFSGDDVIRYVQDALGRTIATDAGDDGSQEHRFYFDGATPESPDAIVATSIGLRSALEDEVGSATWTYDVHGQVAAATRTIDGTTYEAEQSYDLLGRPTLGVFNAPGIYHAVKYGLDSEGVRELSYRTSPSASWTSVVDDLEYDASGRVTKQTSSNGLIIHSTYDDNRLVQRTALMGAEAVLSTSYEYDPQIDIAAKAGYITAIIDNVNPAFTRQFRYDGAYRLSREHSVANGTVDMAYDADGNVIERGPWTFEYDGTQPHAIDTLTNTETGEVRHFAHNGAGNVISDGRRSFTYDAFLLPSSMTNSEGTAQLAYDTDGNLVSRTVYKTVNSPWGDWSYPQWESTLTTPFPGIQANIGPDGEVSFTFDLVANETPVAKRLVSNDGDELLFSVSDHFDSATALIDESGTLVERVRYSAFGEPLNESGAVDWDFSSTTKTFVGMEASARMELYLAGPRTYDPALGVFLQPDPQFGRKDRAETRHPYSYGVNSPLAFKDPSGRTPEDDGREFRDSNDLPEQEIFRQEWERALKSLQVDATLVWLQQAIESGDKLAIAAFMKDLEEKLSWAKHIASIRTLERMADLYGDPTGAAAELVNFHLGRTAHRLYGGPGKYRPRQELVGHNYKRVPTPSNGDTTFTDALTNLTGTVPGLSYLPTAIALANKKPGEAAWSAFTARVLSSPVGAFVGFMTMPRSLGDGTVKGYQYQKVPVYKTVY